MSTLYSQLADALRENAVNREAIEQQDALILHQSDEITQLHARVAEQADYIATLEQHLVEAQRDLEVTRAMTQAVLDVKHIAQRDPDAAQRDQEILDLGAKVRALERDYDTLALEKHKQWDDSVDAAEAAQARIDELETEVRWLNNVLEERP